MSSEINSDKRRQIVLSMKSATHIELSTEAAVALARVVDGKLVGLFVEDEDVFDTARLPFAKVFAATSGSSQQLTQEGLERAYLSSALTCRRTLSAVAKKARLDYSFSTVRGHLRHEIQAHLKLGDYLVIGGECRGLGAIDLIREIRATPMAASGVAVVTDNISNLRPGPVVAIDDGDEGGASVIALASRIAKAKECGVVLLAIAESVDQARRIEQRAHSVVGQGIPLEIHRFMSGSHTSLADTLRQLHPSFVVADVKGEPYDNDQSALTLLRAAKAPTVLVFPED